MITQQPPLQELLAAWNTPDPDKRWEIVQECTSDDGFTYDDVHCPKPIPNTKGFHDFLGVFQERLIDAKVQADGPLEVLRGTARQRFAVVRSGQVFSKGTFFATYDEATMKLTAMRGFVDEMPGVVKKD